MIRINLLGAPKPKNKRGALFPSAEPGHGRWANRGSPKMKILVVLVLAWRRSTCALVPPGQAGADHRQRTCKWRSRRTGELAEVKAKYLERQREADNYKRRVDVIDQLRANQSGPVELLNTIGDTVNSTEAVWLNTMKDQGGSVDIQGMALSTDAVASLILNLQKTGHFTNIEIKETYQDDSVKDMQAFQFTLTCEKGQVLKGR